MSFPVTKLISSESPLVSDLDDRALLVYAIGAKICGLSSIALLAVKLAPEASNECREGFPDELAVETADFHDTWMSPPWWLVGAPVVVALIAPWLWIGARILWFNFKRRKDSP